MALPLKCDKTFQSFSVTVTTASCYRGYYAVSLALSLSARQLVRTESVPCDINNPLRYSDLHISQTLPKTNKINKVRIVAYHYV